MDPESATRELPRATMVVVVRTETAIVGVGVIKRVRTAYSEDVSEKSGFVFNPGIPELGYVAIDGKHRRQGLSHRIVSALLAEFPGCPLFATTDDERMKNTLTKAGFDKRGREWKGNRGKLSLWIRD